MNPSADLYKNKKCCWRNCGKAAANPIKYKTTLISSKAVNSHPDKAACKLLLTVGAMSTGAWYNGSNGKHFVACRKKEHASKAFWKAVSEHRRTTEEKNPAKNKVLYVNSPISDSRRCFLYVATGSVICHWATKAASCHLRHRSSSANPACFACRSFTGRGRFWFSGSFLLP